MPVGDETEEAHFSSSGLTSVELEPVSTEDAAWADSCLIKDSEILGNGWDSVRDALLEALSYQPDAASRERENFPKYYKTTGDVYNSDKANIFVTEKTEVSEPICEDGSSDENSHDFWSRHSMNDVFLPTYSESLKDLGPLDPEEEDLVLHSLELDQSEDEIFKVWDLEIPPVEDELVKQLNNKDLAKQLNNKELAQNSFQPNMTVSDDVDVPLPLHDLISWFKDLSLEQNVK